MNGSIRSLLVLMAGLSLSALAQATCNHYPNNTNGATFPSTITVPANLPVGRLITKVSLSRPFPVGESSCWPSFQSQITGRYAASDQIELGPRLTAYRTNVPGIGLLIHTRPVNTTLFRSVLLHSHPGTVAGRPWVTVHTLTDMEAHFYKIGDISTGTVPAGDLYQNRWHGRLIHTIRLNNSVRFVTPSPTCDLAVGDVNRTIRLDTVQLANFTGPWIGKKPFELTANCNDASNVTFRFTGTPATGNSALFASTGTARGVGLWLYSRIGGSESNLSNGGSRTVNVSANRAVLPLGAAYHKTTGALTKGTLVSNITVNLTYN